VIRRLNEFDFYTTEWPADITMLVNHYFGTVYTIPHSIQVREVVRKFEGQVMLRGLGLNNTQSYEQKLRGMYGNIFFQEIYAIGNRFWFAPAYEQLAEVEHSHMVERIIVLPVGVPYSLRIPKDKRTSERGRILFVCPNCVTNPYNRSEYQKFKREIGGRYPYVVVGAQDSPVDDPHVLGAVSEDQLAQLYSECALLYDQSSERRRIQYSTVEAAIYGIPVVYFRSSLLGRVTPEVALGREASLSEAERSIQRILADDRRYTEELLLQQRMLARRFSREYCRAEWLRNMERSGYTAAVAAQANEPVRYQKFVSTMLRPLEVGLSNFSPKRLLFFYRYRNSKKIDSNRRTIQDGIDFTKTPYPSFVGSISGLSFGEPFGRWSDGSIVDIALNEDLPTRFRLFIKGGAFGPNIGKKVTVTVGRSKQSFVFHSDPSHGEEAIVEFWTPQPEKRIRITVPEPVVSPKDKRRIGLGLRSVRVEAFSHMQRQTVLG
jgi:hypothetical protein